MWKWNLEVANLTKKKKLEAEAEALYMDVEAETEKRFPASLVFILLRILMPFTWSQRAQNWLLLICSVNIFMVLRLKICVYENTSQYKNYKV